MTCKKCGGTDIHIRYDRDRDDCTFFERAKKKGEHLHFYCRQCSFDWTGPTREQIQNAATATND